MRGSGRNPAPCWPSLGWRESGVSRRECSGRRKTLARLQVEGFLEPSGCGATPGSGNCAGSRPVEHLGGGKEQIWTGQSEREGQEGDRAGVQAEVQAEVHQAASVRAELEAAEGPETPRYGESSSRRSELGSCWRKVAEILEH